MNETLTQTARLELWQMTADFLEASLGGISARDVPFKVHPDWHDTEGFIELRLAQYRTDPEYATWGVWAILRQETREMIGHVGFHTAPNADYLRPYVVEAVELGFSIYPQYRSQGFGTEAARGLIAWAVREKQQRRFVVSISPTNDHSQAIARKLGFVRIAEWEDEADGTEIVFLLEVNAASNSAEG